MRDASNANSFYRLDVFAAAKLSKDLRLNFKIANALDRQIYSPPFGGADYDLEWPKRQYSLELLYQF